MIRSLPLTSMLMTKGTKDRPKTMPAVNNLQPSGHRAYTLSAENARKKSFAETITHVTQRRGLHIPAQGRYCRSFITLKSV